MRVPVKFLKLTIDCPKIKEKYPTEKAKLAVIIVNEKYAEPEGCTNKQLCGAFLNDDLFNKYECHFWTPNDELINLLKEQGEL